MSEELYRKHRPTSLKHIVGQERVVKVIREKLKSGRYPHCTLLSGPSGCGKTTIARILQKSLECGDADFSEINGADKRGVDLPREIQGRMNMVPIDGKTKIWLIDEAHQLSSTAQNLFLKMLEDTPRHVYFFLATTDPQKLLSTIKTRATEFKLASISHTQLRELVIDIAKREEVEVPDEVVDKVVEFAEGSARKALVLLDSIIGLEDEEEQLETLSKASHQKEAIEIARALLSPRTTWREMAQIIKGCDLENNDIEGYRYMILGYCTNVLLGSGKLTERAAMIIDFFSSNFYDSKKYGFIAACYEVINRK